MIKNLITSMMLATSIGIQNTNIVSDAIKSTYQNTTSVNSMSEYYNEELESYRQYSVLNYKIASMGANYKINTKTLKYITRDIAENQYTYREQIVIEIQNTGNIDDERINIQQKVEPNYLTYASSYAGYCYKITTINPEVELFMEGNRYYSYGTMQTLSTKISQYELWISDGTPSQNSQVISYTIENPVDYYVIEYLIDLDETKIDDTAPWLNNLVQTKELSYTITYNRPDIAGYEVVDIPGMMFTILGMPFAWLSTAFNFTIFEGTPYAINISSILMAIVIGLIAIYIAKKIIK